MRLFFLGSFLIFLPLDTVTSDLDDTEYDLYKTTFDPTKPLKQLDELTGMAKLLAIDGKYVEWAVSKRNLQKFKEKVTKLGYTYSSYKRNVILDPGSMTTLRRKRKMSWKRFHPLGDIYIWLKKLSRHIKRPRIKLVIGGKTYEGRKIVGIGIKFGNNLPGVFIHSGTNGREWLGPAITSWIIHQIVKSPRHSIFRKFNYIYFPVLNPDGYVYSWTTDPLWKKTRTPYKSNEKICYGADMNRNWDFKWNVVGTSQDPCSELYAGPHAFSEIETKTLSSYIKKIKKPLKLEIYLGYRSFGDSLLYPWWYTITKAPQKNFWERAAAAAAKAYKAIHNHTLNYGQSSKVLSPVSGTSEDWFVSNFNSTTSFTIQMKDLGILVPPSEIIPLAHENFAALRAILKEYLKKKYKRKRH